MAAEIVSVSSLAGDEPSSAPPKPMWPPIPAGEEFHRSSAMSKSEKLLRASKLKRASPRHLTRQQLQMVLGTQLGDAHMGLGGTYPGYASNHGWVQAEYNWLKYLILSAYTATPPAKRKNKGYGDYLSMFKTLTSPAFSYCYHLTCDLDGQKRVTAKLLRTIEKIGIWEAVAWWVGDDGGLNGRSMVLHTEGFKQAEVQLLAKWLRKHGVSCTAAEVRRKKTGSIWWVVRCTVAGTRFLCQKISPVMPPPMRGKAVIPSKKDQAVCCWCGQTFQLQRPHPQYPEALAASKIQWCCPRKACRRARHRQTSARHMRKPGVREHKNQKAKTRYYDDLEKSRERGRLLARRLREEKPEMYKAAKQRHVAKKRAIRQAGTWKCQRCGAEEPLGNKHPTTQYCPACREIVTKEQKRAFEQEKKKKRHEAWTKPCWECGKVFAATSAKRAFCSDPCKRNWTNRKRRKQPST